MNLIYGIQSLRPNSNWVLHGNTLDSLEWLDENQSRPSNEEILAAAVEPVKPNYELFVEQCYLIPGFTTEIAINPGWLAVQQRLEKGDYSNALAVFSAMDVPGAIIDAMLPLAVANDLPQPVIDALSS
jgi:hypothetical protein